MGLDYTSAIKITAQYSGAGVDQARRGIAELKGEASGSIAAFRGAKEALEGLVAALAIERVIEWGKGILELGEHLFNLSQKTGINVQTLSNLKTSAELNGVAFEGLEGALRKFDVAIANATHGNREAEGAFRAVGISLKDLKSGDPSKLLGDVAARFAEMKDGPDKAAIAVRLFGRTGTDLIPMLNELGEGAGNLGVRISDDFAGRAKHFNDSLTLMGVKAKQVGVDILEGLLPALQDIVNVFSKSDNGGGSAEDAVTWLDYVGEGLRHLTAAGVEAAAAAKVLWYGFKMAAVEVWEILKLVNAELLASVELAVAAVRAFALDFDGAGAAIDRFATKGKQGLVDFYGNSGRTGDKFIAETLAAYKTAQEKLAGLQRNSLMFGEGSEADIKRRMRLETAGAPRRRATGAPDEGLDHSQQQAIEAVQARIAKIQAETRSTNDSNAAKAIAVELAELEAKKIDKSSAAYEGLRQKLIAVTYAREVGKEKQQSSDFLNKEKDQIDQQALALEQYHMTTGEFQKLTEAKKIDAQVSEASKHMTEEGKDAMLRAAEAAKELRGNLIDMQEAQKQSIGEGAAQAWHDFAEAARNTAAQTKQVLGDAFRGAEDAFVKFVHTGKISFASLAASIEDDLLRIAFRKAILGFGASFIGGAAGGVGNAGGGSSPFLAANGGVVGPDGVVPLRKYAGGGVANSPQMAIFGEGSRPEAYVPLNDGRSIPVTMKGAGGGNSFLINVNVGEGGTSSSQSGTANDQGKQLGSAITAAVTAELVKQKRPGGLLA